MGNDLRVAVVGCGQIADAHFQEINRVPGATIVAACDANADVAFQAAARFGVRGIYSETVEMLRQVQPDIVHITVPAHVRAPLVKQCLSAGAHVYVEKPVALDTAELSGLYRAAAPSGRMVCPGHDQLFDPAWTDVRALRDAGVLGEVVHVDVVQGYDLSGPYGQVLQSNPAHWVRSLPGGLFQNIISHALGRICDLHQQDFDGVTANWNVRRGNRGNLPAELRVSCESGSSSATLLFSAAARPVQRTATVYGTKATAFIDMDARSVRVLRPNACPTALLKLYLPAVGVTVAARGLWKNLRRARSGGLGYFAGMRTLFARFYESVRDGGPCPIEPAEALRVTRLMDRIIDECAISEAAGQESHIAPRALAVQR